MPIGASERGETSQRWLELDHDQARVSARPQQRLRERTAFIRDGVLLLAVSAALSAHHWLKVEQLISGDNVRWFLETYRAASGEVPYRDFAWIYPPLGLWAIAAPMRVLGSTFVVMQIVIDLLSLAICGLVWQIARKLLPRGPAFAAALLTALSGASNNGNFALFSLQIYTPSQLTGTLGMLMFVLPLVDRLEANGQARGFHLRQIALLSLGGAAACLSKVEFIVGVAGACLLFAVLDRSDASRSGLKRKLTVAVSGLVPSVLVYAGLAAQVGLPRVLEGVSCYGVATQTCPFWPTGLGLFSALAGASKAVVFAAGVSLLRFSTFLRRYGYRYVAGLGLAGLGVWCVWVQVPRDVAAFSGSQPTGTASTVLLVSQLISVSGILLPVMWTGIAFVAYALLHRARHREVRTRLDAAAGSVLLAGTAAAINSRGLFGNLFGTNSVVSSSAYPLLFILAAWLALGLIRGLTHEQNRWATLLVTVIFVAYAGTRLSVLLKSALNSSHTTLETEAGPVQLGDSKLSAELYRQIIEHTAPDARLLEVPFGGGLTFASHRRSSSFSNQFTALAPSQEVRQLDLRRVQSQPPDLVIASDAPNFGSSFGLSLGCSFPHLSWSPPRRDPRDTPLAPALELIRARYRPLSHVGDRVLLVPR